jgi:hypothetical protein
LHNLAITPTIENQQQQMPKHHNEHAADHQHHESPKYAGLHKDWRAWAVVVLMLIGMAGYILSFDESETPGGKSDGLEVPAASP